MNHPASKAGSKTISRMSRKAQSWSTDLILGVVVFLLIITIFYTFGNKDKGTKTEQLQQEGEQIAAKLDTETGAQGYPVIKNGVIDDNQIVKLYNTTYDQMLSDLELSGKFCIFIEDQDGKVIVLDNKTGAGNTELTVAGTSCGQNVP